MNLAQFILHMIGDRPEGPGAAVMAALAASYFAGILKAGRSRATFADIERLRGMLSLCPGPATFYADDDAQEAILAAAEALGRKVFAFKPHKATTTGAISRNAQGVKP
jgi:hypothetical protein